MVVTFHLTMGYYDMVGKKMDGSGFTDILLEANLMSSGSMTGVLSGKNFNRTTKCHKVMFEALHRLLFLEFLQNQGKQDMDDCFTDKTLAILNFCPKTEQKRVWQ